MYTFPAIPWLRDWKSNIEPTQQVGYIRDELVRIAAAGAPVLSMVLALGEHEQRQKDIAVSLLQKRVLGNHRFLFRLAPGVKPPIRDAEGNEVPDGERGHVLYAKTGTKGGQIVQSDKNPHAAAEYTGSAMASRAMYPTNDISLKQNYVYAKVGREPVELEVGDAVIVMQRYGVGIVRNRYHGRTKRRDERGNPIERDALGQLVQEVDFWLVEEVPPQFVNSDGSVREPSKDKSAQQNNPKRAA